MEITQGFPYRKYTFYISAVVVLFGVLVFFLRSFISIQDRPIWNSIVYIEKNQAIMKEDIEDLEKNYEQYARCNLEVLTHIETLLITLSKERS